MISSSISYKRHRFPPQIIAPAVWLYASFNLSLREVDEMQLQCGIDVSYETARRWVIKFGPQIVRKLRQRQDRPGDIWHLDDGCRENFWPQVLALARGRSAWRRSG